jgi:hypothetical protein
MMTKRTVGALLRAFSERGIERPGPGLASRVKRRIPSRLIPHRMDTINIIVDLRVNRLAAAAAIVIAMVLIGLFFGGRDAVGRQTVRDSKLFLKYTLGGERACRAEIVQGLSDFRDDLEAQGREVVYYGPDVDLDDRYAVLMHWKLSDSEYGVILGDLSARTVAARTLIRLQSRMIEEGAKRR